HPPHYAEEVRYRSAQPVPAAPARTPAAADIAEALVGLRQDLKRDISDGLVREMHALRSEIRGIKAEAAQDRGFAADIRADMQRLAENINQLGRHAPSTQADALRVEFDDLRAMLDGLAREDSMRRIENRWTGVEDRLNAFDQSRDDELVALAYRLDEIKSQIGAMNKGLSVGALEDKLVAVAQAVEMLGRQMQPDDRRLAPHFAELDARLDEISRAIAVNSRSAGGTDTSFVNRLESRLGDLSRQIDNLSRPTDSGLGARIEALTARVEDLAGESSAARLEELLDQLSALLERGQHNVAPELTDYLADISRKIEALDQGSLNDALAERLDYLARRIDELDVAVDAPMSDSRFDRLEDRLADIAQRLEETHAAPFDDREALRNLEAQISNLSTLVSQSHQEPGSAAPAEFESRMSALEDYLATSDEYIIEAARQAAEAVMEAYARNGVSQTATGTDMAAISALAEDLRTLEDLSRSSDERTARTFEALHETLVHIAEKLERLEDREPRQGRGAPVMPQATQPEFADPFAAADLDDGYRDVQRDVRAVQAEDAAAVASPAAAGAAASLEVSTVDRAETRLEAPAAKVGLLAGLTRRFTAKRGEAAPLQARQVVEPTPSIDAAEMLAPEEANQLLEPGSGVPDVKKILERVRAGQMARGGQQAAGGDKSDFIAAARRAAQLAVEEADTLSRTKDKKTTSAIGGAFARHRRPILMAVGAVLLAIMSYPLVSTVLKGNDAPSAQPVAAIERQADADVLQPKANFDNAAEIAPAAVQAAVESPAAPATVETPPAPAQVPSAAAGEGSDAAGGAGATPMLQPTSGPTGPVSTFEP
ncbi:MAG TPA: peptidoglycan-binding protein, partial [Sinorhizobium sp.]|nr:peptidoglycan-binding protein [Sinorhizobium sp.]